MVSNHIGMKMVIKSKKKLWNGKQEGLRTLFYNEMELKKKKLIIRMEFKQAYGQIGFLMDKNKERFFSNGERDSIWTTWYKNGNKILQATYSNGKLNGKYTSWFDGGIIKEKEVDYLNNKKHNKWTFWSEKGQKTEEITYNNGIQNGKHIKWFGNTNDQHKKFEINYADGEKNGLCFYWYHTGIDSIQSNYNNGKKDGHWIWWDQMD